MSETQIPAVAAADNTLADIASRYLDAYKGRDEPRYYRINLETAVDRSHVLGMAYGY